MLSDVLHHFSKNHVIHQFKEIFFEIGHSHSSKLGIEIDVGLHPCGLIEFNHLMDPLKYQSMVEGLIKTSNVNNITFLSSALSWVLESM